MYKRQGRTRPERPDYQETESAARRIADLEREVKQREQSREHSSLKEDVYKRQEKIQKVIKKVIINGEDNIEIIWNTDDPFFK